jgi:hypothetical protein
MPNTPEGFGSRGACCAKLAGTTANVIAMAALMSDVFMATTSTDFRRMLTRPSGQRAVPFLVRIRASANWRRSPGARSDVQRNEVAL